MKHLSNETGIYSLDCLKNHYYRKTQGHWFDKDTLRFFGSRISDQLFYGSKNIYFVSSEVGPHQLKRLYTVRQYNPETGAIETIGDFQQYKSMSGAKSAAKRLAEQEKKEA